MNTQIQRTPEGLFALMRRHPYLLTIILCGLLTPFGFADRAEITVSSCIYLGVVAGVFAVFAVLYFNLGRNTSERLLLIVIALSYIAAAMILIGYFKNKTVTIAVIALISAFGVILFIRTYHYLSDYSVIAVFIVLGIVIRFIYVLYTGSSDRQHDVGYFNHTWGHANYIEYWYKNGLKLPDFDVRNFWQYYHPPLHHWLMAAFLRILTSLDIAYAKACEALQMLPLLYSSLTMIVSYRIFRLVKLKGAPLIAATAIVCFHPTFIFFAGSFNNDMLLMLFMMGSILWGLRWYREPTFGNIVPLALCIGLGMMTKLSGWMVAPAVAFLLIAVLIRNIKKPLKYIGQYALFGVISVPLGLWWQIRNLIKFNVPLTYVPFLNTQDPIYMGDLSVGTRLFGISGESLGYVYDAFTYLDAPYNESNPTLGLFKSAAFGEGNNSINDTHFPQIRITGPILFWISVVLFLICFVCFIVSMIKKSENINGVERFYFTLLFAVILGCYYWFCFAYPFTCTFNIRYAMPLIPLCAMGLAMVTQRTLSSKKAAATWFRRVMYALTAASCAMSYLVYTQVGATM